MPKSETAANTEVTAKRQHAEARQELRIGARVRHARLRKGLTLKALADEIACSESFISKIEHNRVRPSLAMLHQLVRALDLNVAALFDQSPHALDPVVIVRPHERPLIRAGAARKGSGVTLLRLIPGTGSKLLEANVHVVEPGGGSDGKIQHDGEEMGYVLEGVLELHILDKKYLVHAHSSFFFPSNLAHSYKNPGTDQVSVIWINTPPTF